MALIQYDLVEETTTTTGAGALTLAGALEGRRTFAAAGGGAAFQCHYRLIAEDGSFWELGIGYYSSGVLTRNTVFRSSDGDYLTLDLPAGVKHVALVQAASAAPAVWLNGLSTPPQVAEFAQNAQAWGSSAYAGAAGAVAIGNLAAANQAQSVAIGDSSIASGSGCVAIGSNAYALGTNCIALGGSTEGSATNAVAGPGANNGTNHSFMVGTLTSNVQGGFFVRNWTTSGTTQANVDMGPGNFGRCSGYEAIVVVTNTTNRAMYRVSWIVAGSTSAVYGATVTELHNSFGSPLTLTPAIGGSNITLNCTGLAGLNLRWGAHVRRVIIP